MGDLKGYERCLHALSKYNASLQTDLGIHRLLQMRVVWEPTLCKRQHTTVVSLYFFIWTHNCHKISLSINHTKEEGIECRLQHFINKVECLVSIHKEVVGTIFKKYKKSLMTFMTQLLEPPNIKSEKGIMVENSQCYKHSEKELGSFSPKAQNTFVWLSNSPSRYKELENPASTQRLTQECSQKPYSSEPHTWNNLNVH